NINPLIRLDGYYVLMDWIQVPGLRESSFEYIGNLVKKHVLHLQVQDKAIPRRRRRIYLIYGLLAIGYSSFILWVVFRLLRRGGGWWAGRARPGTSSSRPWYCWCSAAGSRRERPSCATYGATNAICSARRWRPGLASAGSWLSWRF